MWVGKELADGLDFSGFIISMIIGGLILSLYTGLLGYVGAETGMSLDLLARKAFGAKGSYLPSAIDVYKRQALHHRSHCHDHPSAHAQARPERKAAQDQGR